MRLTIPIRATGALLLITLAGCGGQPAIRPAAFPPQCDILAVPDNPVDSITVALLDSFEPGYPWARTTSERILTRHCYETLVTLDCEGDVRPALAQSWSREDRGRRWRIVLRPGARFWDGAAVTAYDVEASWENAMTLDTSVDSVAVLNEQVLYVYCENGTRDIPHALASPMFAVFKPSDVWYWFDGTGPYYVESEERAQRSVTLRPSFGRKRPVIRFRRADADQVRDVLERGVDLLVTDDPAGIEYASTRAHYKSHALPWDRTYVLLSTSRASRLRYGESVKNVSSEFAGLLARDAVRVDARGSQPPAWWKQAGECRDEIGDRGIEYSPTLNPPRRIVFDADDPVARSLAERIVALAAVDPEVSSDAAELAAAVPWIDSDRVVAQASTADALTGSLALGDEFAYVVAMDRLPSDACYEAREWLRRAPWLGVDGTDFRRVLIPLVDVRSHVIVRTDRFGLSVDGQGNILVVDERPKGGQLP